MGGQSREGRRSRPASPSISSLTLGPGGKVKPLKAPKKEKKDMDEDEIAFKAKQQAGTSSATRPLECPLIDLRRCQSEERHGRAGQRQRPSERWTTRNQEKWQEVKSVDESWPICNENMRRSEA